VNVGWNGEYELEGKENKLGSSSQSKPSLEKFD